MATKPCISASLTVFLFFEILISFSFAATDPPDVTALQELYRTLSYPPQLEGWKSDGGDPCEESWKGISCNGSSVIFIKLSGLNLGGNLGWQLNFLNVKQLDLSYNHIQGEIPAVLPHNATHIDLSCNNFSMNLPYSLAYMKHLHYLNASHNDLSGPIGNIFTGLQNLKRMDLSYNSFTGDLPSSFGNLTNLTGLYLQNNKFTGSVIFLANLQLADLNIQKNHFSGVVPKQLLFVPNLWIGGNAFQFGADYPPLNFPQDTIPNDHNINSPPATKSNAIEIHPSLRVRERKKKWLIVAVLACLVGVVALVTICSGLGHACYKRKRSNENLEAGVNLPTRYRSQLTAKRYTEAELIMATKNFACPIGEGSLGSVYKAKLSDGQVLAVKRLNKVALLENDKFLEVAFKVAELRHPSILGLVGYCIEEDRHFLVYKYADGGSLRKALRSGNITKWDKRIKIALGVAKGLHYLHSKSPIVAHHNFRADQILLIDELPLLSDCGLEVLRSYKINSSKIKCLEPTTTWPDYSAPESNQPGKDIYMFGLLLLELLTGSAWGRFNFESIMFSLHDYESMLAMCDIDPIQMKNHSSSSFLRYGHLVLFCLQDEAEYRPQLSEIITILESLDQSRREAVNKRDIMPLSSELEDVSLACSHLWNIDDRLNPTKDYSLRSTVRQGQGHIFRFLTWNGRKTHDALLALTDSFDSPVSAKKHAELQNDFVAAICQTKEIQYVYRYFVLKQVVSTRGEFEKLLHDTWFNTSLFRHVFVGETNNIVVHGLHNYLRLYQLESKGVIHYRWRIMGGPQSITECGRRLLNVGFSWDHAQKCTSSMFIGTSPQFEMAVYLLCFRFGAEEENAVDLGGYSVKICTPRDPKKKIWVSAYPTF